MDRTDLFEEWKRHLFSVLLDYRTELEKRSRKQNAAQRKILYQQFKAANALQAALGKLKKLKILKFDINEVTLRKVQTDLEVTNSGLLAGEVAGHLCQAYRANAKWIGDLEDSGSDVDEPRSRSDVLPLCFSESVLLGIALFGRSKDELANLKSFLEAYEGGLDTWLRENGLSHLKLVAATAGNANINKWKDAKKQSAERSAVKELRRNGHALGYEGLNLKEELHESLELQAMNLENGQKPESTLKRIRFKITTLIFSSPMQ